jgi:glycerophosphoryl diester phosphodiesterase
MTLVVAHRGASAIAPENTLEAFERAIEVGADMVEFDVRATADGTLVVVHDPLPPVPYGELSTKPPTLAQVVETCAGRIALDVEIKVAGIEASVLDIVGTRFAAGEFVVTSFLGEAVRGSKQHCPDVRAGLLLARDHVFAPGDRSGADFLAPHVTLLNEAPLEDTRELVVWTVNDAERLRRCLADPRVDAVITDDPELALSLR